MSPGDVTGVGFFGGGAAWDVDPKTINPNRIAPAPTNVRRVMFMLQPPTSYEQIIQDQDNHDNKQEVNDTSSKVRYKTNKPECENNHDDKPKNVCESHVLSPI